MEPFLSYVETYSAHLGSKHIAMLDIQNEKLLIAFVVAIAIVQ